MEDIYLDALFRAKKTVEDAYIRQSIARDSFFVAVNAVGVFLSLLLVRLFHEACPSIFLSGAFFGASLMTIFLGLDLGQHGLRLLIRKLDDTIRARMQNLEIEEWRNPLPPVVTVCNWVELVFSSLGILFLILSLYQP